MIPAKEIEGELWIKASDHYQALKNAKQKWIGLSYSEILNLIEEAELDEDKDIYLAQLVDALLQEKNT